MTDIYEKLLKSDFILKVKNSFLVHEIQTKTQGDISDRHKHFLYSGNRLIQNNIVLCWISFSHKTLLCISLLMKYFLETSRHGILLH